MARFSILATGRAERDWHYLLKSQLPPQDEELEWTAVSPSLPGAASPEFERAVVQINEEFAHPAPQNVKEVLELVEDLHANPPTSPAAGTVENKDPDLLPPHFEEDSVPTPLPPTIMSETVTEAAQPPLFLANRGMATMVSHKGKPNPPTAATKCSRKEYQRPSEEVVRRKAKKPKALSALKEIRKFQTEVEPILPWLPFVRVIHKLLFEQGPYRIWKEVIKALRVAGEQYLLEVLGGGNLACIHRDRCTLAPKDIHLFCMMKGDIDKYGETDASEEARRVDWHKYRKGHLTVSEAMVLDTCQKQKLKALLQRRRQCTLGRHH